MFISIKKKYSKG